MSECNEEFVFTWSIENFFLISNTLNSPVFYAANFEGNRWRIGLHQSISGFVDSELNFLDSNFLSEKVTISIEIELCSALGEVFASAKNEKIPARCESPLYSIRNLICIKELEEKMRTSESNVLVVRCRLRVQTDEASGSPAIIYCSAKTKICFDSFSFLWEVENIRSPKWSETKTFPVNDIMQFCFNLKTLMDDLVFEISQVSKKKTIFPKVKCEILLLDSKGEEICSICHNFKSSESPSLSLLKKSVLEEKIEKNGLMYLKFKFSIPNDIYFEEYIEDTLASTFLSPPGVSKKLSATESLSSDFRVMLCNKEHSDISLRVDGEILSAHKFVLALRSPVFSAMLKQDMIESQSGVINITDMDVETLKLFLEFIYTGEVENLEWKRALDLLLAAEKYQVSSLKKECSEFLKNVFSTDNICDVVSVAEMVGQESLKAAAIDYIKENSTVILVSPNLLNLVKKNGELCSEIFYSLSQELSKK